MPDAITHLAILDHPIDPIPTRDGCWIFVSVSHDSTPGGISVLRRREGTIDQVRFVPLEGTLFGMVLTHNEQVLVVSAGSRVTFVDVGKLESGDGNPVLGSIRDSTFVGSVIVTVTADDKYLFVSQERTATITVIDLSKALATGFSPTAIIGGIPTGRAPVSLIFSPNEQYLYATSQGSPDGATWPIECRPQTNRSDPPDHPQGAILVIDVSRAEVKPEASVVAVTRAGCNPVRLVLSRDGKTAYVTARGDDALLVFDTRRILGDTAHAIIGKVSVGVAPVGLALIEGGTRVVVTNSNRFAGGPSDRQNLTVIDAARVADGVSAVLGTIPAGGFPRQLHVTADGRTLLVSNYTSGTLQVIDLVRVRLRPAN